jgi:hypothetical protein
VADVLCSVDFLEEGVRGNGIVPLYCNHWVSNHDDACICRQVGIKELAELVGGTSAQIANTTFVRYLILSGGEIVACRTSQT